MRKFDNEEVPRPAELELAGGGPAVRPPAVVPASGRSAQRDQLRDLVKFAISQGYYERWNKPPTLV
jgi:hypothetical protein